MKTVTIVAPTLNEEANIEEFLKRTLALQKKLRREYILKVLVVDSHSKDNTTQIVKRYVKRYKRKVFLLLAPRGLGLSLTTGLDYAVQKLKADQIITLEADLSNQPSQIPQFLAKLKKADLVLGSRYMTGGQVRNWSWWRKGLSQGANVLLRLLINWNTHEFTNLYRGFNSQVWLQLRKRIKNEKGWLFVPAFAFNALTLDIKVKELPIVYSDRRAGKSKMNTPSYTKSLLLYAITFRMKQYAN